MISISRPHGSWYYVGERKETLNLQPSKEKAHNRTSNSPLRMEGGRIILCNKCKISAKKIYCDDHSSLSSTTAIQYEFHIYLTSFHCKGRYELNVWLHSSVGRASHRYRGGHGFESRWSPDIFRASSFQLLKKKIYILHFHPQPQYNMNFIYIPRKNLWRELYFSPTFSGV